MRFAGPVPFSLPTQNINSKSGEFLEFFSVLDLSHKSIAEQVGKLRLVYLQEPINPGFSLFTGYVDWLSL